MDNHHNFLEEIFIQIVTERTGGEGGQASVGRAVFGSESGATIWRNVRNSGRSLKLSEASALAELCGKPLSLLIAEAEIKTEAKRPAQKKLLAPQYEQTKLAG